MFLHAYDFATGAQRRVRLDADSWYLEACPISGSSLAVDGDRALAAWEHEGMVLMTQIKLPELLVEHPLAVGRGKYPLVVIGKGSLLVAWKDGKRLHWSIRDEATLKESEAGSAGSDSYDRPTGVADAGGRFLLFP